MPMPIPLPTAQPPEIERVQTLYAARYGVTLGFEEARDLLEGVMRFIYLTQIEPQVASRRAAGADHEPLT